MSKLVKYEVLNGINVGDGDTRYEIGDTAMLDPKDSGVRWLLSMEAIKLQESSSASATVPDQDPEPDVTDEIEPEEG